MTAYTVTIRFQHPAWDEKDGIAFDGIAANSKADAISKARKLAERNGHTGTGKGRCTFRAEDSDVRG